MRRLLRKLCCLDTNLGDTTSLSNADIVQTLRGIVMETVISERKQQHAVAHGTPGAGNNAAAAEGKAH